MDFNARIDRFQGTDSQYIRYLEGEVTYLRVHYPVQSSLSRSFSARAVIPAYNTAKDFEPQQRQDGSIISDSSGMQFILYQPHLYQPHLETTPRPLKHPRQVLPRWREVADELLRNLPLTHQWCQKREEMNLKDEVDLLRAYSAILSINQAPEIRNSHEPASALVVDQHKQSCSPCDVARAYALATKRLEDRSKFVVQVLSFRQLVFTSLCVLLGHMGVRREAVESIMQVCISDSDGRHLSDIRQGAIWVNRMIAYMMEKGSGNRASEIFVISEFPSHTLLRF